MKVLHEAADGSVFKKRGWINMMADDSAPEIKEEALTEGIYDDIEVGTCFKIPDDPNKTVYEIDDIIDENGTDVAIFGSHGHKFHTQYRSTLPDLKNAFANGQLIILTSEAEKDALRQYN